MGHRDSGPTEIHRSMLAGNIPADADAVVTERTCGICLDDSKNPLDLPCGHSFCDGCLGEWRPRYRVKEEMRTNCPICRARIPPSKEMVATLLTYRAQKQRLEDNNKTSSEVYREVCHSLKQAEERVGADWDGVTVLEDNNDKPAIVMPFYIRKATRKGDIKSVLRWINANRSEDRANATTSVDIMGLPLLYLAAVCNHVALMSLLLQLGTNVNRRDSRGFTTIGLMFANTEFTKGGVSGRVRLLLSWGANFFTECRSREECISAARNRGEEELAKLLESELGGRRCEIANLTSRPGLN